MSKLETNQVDPATGTTLTLGTSGDTITIPSGVTIANSGTATGFGGTNTPAFSVRKSGDQSLDNSETNTKITFDTEDVDTNGTFASNKFTPAVAGKYFITLNVFVESTGNGEVQIITAKIYKNGSQISGSDGRVDFRGNPGRGAGVSTTVLVDLDTDDYIEGFAANSANGSSSSIKIGGTRMQGFKIIE
jgi:hypothetical protein